MREQRQEKNSDAVLRRMAHFDEPHGGGEEGKSLDPVHVRAERTLLHRGPAHAPAAR